MTILLTTEEKMVLKAALSKKIASFISEQTIKDNNIGFLPDNITGLMTESAFAVLEATNSLNAYLEKENLLT